MKKALIILLAVAICLSLASCSGAGDVRTVEYVYDGEGNLTYVEEARLNLNEYGADHKVYPGRYTAWEYTYDKEGRIDTVTEKDLGYLNDAREQVDSSGNPTSDPDLEFDRVTKYYYGTFFGVEKVSD